MSVGSWARHSKVAIQVVIGLALVAFIAALFVWTNATYAQRQQDCRDAGGTPVADTCYAPGVVLEP